MAWGLSNGILPEGWTWSDVGHGALDIAGLVPVIGEGADLANAAWLAAEGDYLGAGLSVISMVPIVGDAIGKGGKLLKSGAGKLAGPALDALKRMDFEKVLGGLRKHPKLGPHIDKIIAALEKWRADIVGTKPPCTPGGVQKCPLPRSPTGPLGSKRAPLQNSKFQSVRNQPARINGRDYSGHALDQMQNRGFTPSVVDQAIKTGAQFPTKPGSGTKGFYDAVNDVRVIVNSTNGRVVTVIPGAPK